MLDNSTRCEGQNWAQMDVDFPMESAVITMLRYIKGGRIRVDKSKNPDPATYHDSCNFARCCGMTEEPQELLQLVCGDFREMYPNRAENFCCTGGGGAMSMSEYAPRRLKSAKIKAEQLRATGAKTVVTSCHNCVDGLYDLIRHYKLDMKVTQLVNLVANALVLPEVAKPAAKAAVEAAPERVAAEAVALFMTRAAECNAALVTKLSEAVEPIQADPKDIHSLVANLIMNALDACRSDETEGKAHRVSLRVFQDGGRVMIEVKDNGAGMDADTKNRLFNMLYSTKGAFGTGLGLLVSHKVATEHGGTISVESAPARARLSLSRFRWGNLRGSSQSDCLFLHISPRVSF